VDLIKRLYAKVVYCSSVVGAAGGPIGFYVSAGEKEFGNEEMRGKGGVSAFAFERQNKYPGECREPLRPSFGVYSKF
jgi:hypothetical protein